MFLPTMIPIYQITRRHIPERHKLKEVISPRPTKWIEHPDRKELTWAYDTCTKYAISGHIPCPKNRNSCWDTVLSVSPILTSETGHRLSPNLVWKVGHWRTQNAVICNLLHTVIPTGQTGEFPRMRDTVPVACRYKGGVLYQILDKYATFL